MALEHPATLIVVIARESNDTDDLCDTNRWKTESDLLEEQIVEFSVN